jgi:hypothetical protein
LKEREANRSAVRAHVGRIQVLTSRVIDIVSKELGEDVSRLDGPDRDAAQELFEWRLQTDDEFDELVRSTKQRTRTSGQCG